MKDSPLACTNTGTSFKASSVMGDVINLDIMDVTFSATTAATAVILLTTDAEMQTDNDISNPTLRECCCSHG